MFEKLCKNLNLLMDEAHINASELARRTGLPASTIKKIRNYENPNPTLTSLLPIAQFFSISLSELIGEKPLPKSRIKGLYQENLKTLSNIPIIDWEEVLMWPNVKHHEYPFVTTEHEYAENIFALKVNESDWINLSQNTILLVDPSLPAEHRDFAIIYKQGQKIPTLKQVLLDDEKLYLKSLVYEYNIVPFSKEYKLIGIVVEYKKNLRKNILTSSLKDYIK